jgi:hypothetical protein
VRKLPATQSSFPSTFSCGATITTKFLGVISECAKATRAASLGMNAFAALENLILELRKLNVLASAGWVTLITF